MDQQQHFRDLLARFDKARVMVVGDIYLDENVFGTVTGISLEAPIPVYEVQERRHNPGAAGNAACNVAALGATTYMVGVVGDDVNGQIVRKEFQVRNVNADHLVIDPKAPTNTYGKLRAGTFNAPAQEILRTDTPRPTFLRAEIEDQLIEQMRALAPQVDCIIAVDQVSAVCTRRVLDEIVALAAKHKLLTVGDSRERAGELKGFDVIVPNDREAGKGAGIEVTNVDTLRKAGQALLKVCKSALITRGPHGISIFAADGSITDVPISPRNVIDVTGAGDTVTAAVAVTLVSGGTFHDAAVVGNSAAGIAVEKPGVVTVPRAELEKDLMGGGGPTKLRSIDQLVVLMEQLRQRGKTVIWTNGCFDLLHVGHITYLLRAAQEGDVLIVGLNSDASVKKNKGPDRPVNNELHRAQVLSALECVSYVTIFDEPSPMGIIERLKPDVYAKGGDYTIDTINQDERKIVEGYGGRIALVEGVEGQSTTAIIGKISQEKAPTA
ncbi:MAG: PfkB family carbohydrate kinase [FCB group bacterium]|jgi:D-beta-D-heptose 7-phosphate kinase/D-beta-D-heptose 1-phosphate adenosyltransferase|nr:PfkB family carbohydrate kinase [FCB group bacterium]